MAIQTTIEAYTDEIKQQGASIHISYHARIQFTDGRTEWHYWGTTAPQGAVQHDAVHIPPDLLSLSDANDELYRLAFKIGPVRDGLS